MTSKENIKIHIIFIILFLILSICLLGSSFLTLNKERDICINNPPSADNVIEDLENVFFTKNIEVLKIIYENDFTFYIIKANGYYYKIIYQMQLVFFRWHWKYIKNILIHEEMIKQ